CTAPNDFDYW
nr:immunoglobulin heavy chain junction region [Mus musculus]